MSLAQIEAEIPRLSADELRELNGVVQAALREKAAAPSPDPGQWLGSLTGTIKFGPGWDDPLPLEDWEALRDGSSTPSEGVSSGTTFPVSPS